MWKRSALHAPVLSSPMLPGGRMALSAKGTKVSSAARVLVLRVVLQVDSIAMQYVCVGEGRVGVEETHHATVGTVLCACR